MRPPSGLDVTMRIAKEFGLKSKTFYLNEYEGKVGDNGTNG